MPVYSFKGTGNGKIKIFFKALTPRSWTCELRGQGKKKKSIYKIKDKHTPQTVLQKLSPKVWHAS